MMVSNIGNPADGTRQKHADDGGFANGIGVHQVKLRVISDAVDGVFAWRMKMKLNQLVDVGRLRSDVKVAGGIVGHFDIVAGILDLQRSRLVLEQRCGKVRQQVRWRERCRSATASFRPHP